MASIPLVYVLTYYIYIQDHCLAKWNPHVVIMMTFIFLVYALTYYIYKYRVNVEQNGTHSSIDSSVRMEVTAMSRP